MNTTVLSRLLTCGFVLLGICRPSWQEKYPPFAIQVNAASTLHPIPCSIFGTFLEPIGNSIYGGLWAEILQNPSLEANLWSAKQIAELVKQRPKLARASDLALPLPWEPLDYAQGAR